MATGSELQCRLFTGDAGTKLPAHFELRVFWLRPAPKLLRRANEPQKCFVSGETESVANTSAFVGPVALNSPEQPPI